MTNPKPRGTNGLTYRDAGVDIDEGERLVELIKPAAKSTARPGAEAALGGFAAAFDPKAAGFKDPIFLATTDGVGTKLKIAIESGRHDTVGIDLVAMCVNDLSAQGAEPLMFLDYYATGKLNADEAAKVVLASPKAAAKPAARSPAARPPKCRACTAKGDYDLAGFSVGAAERGTLLPRVDEMQAGDVIIGIASSGPHSNGYSLVRKIVERSGLAWDAPAPFAPGKSLAEALLDADAHLREGAEADLRREARKGRGAHHRRRLGREHAARAARSLARRIRLERLGAPGRVRMAASNGRRPGRRHAPHVQSRHRHDARR